MQTLLLVGLAFLAFGGSSKSSTPAPAKPTSPPPGSDLGSTIGSFVGGLIAGWEKNNNSSSN